MYAQRNGNQMMSHLTLASSKDVMIIGA